MEDAAALLKELTQLAREEVSKRYSGTDVLLGTYSLEFNAWLAEKMKTVHHMTVTKLTPENQYLYYSLRDIGVVIDKYTGVYLLRGETEIRRTTLKDLNQLVFSLWMLHNTPLRYCHLTEEKVSPDDLQRLACCPF